MERRPLGRALGAGGGDPLFPSQSFAAAVHQDDSNNETHPKAQK